MLGERAGAFPLLWDDPGMTPTTSALDRIEAEIVGCRACPRLVAWREDVARDKVARFADQEYWGKPVPGFGDPLPA